MAHKDKYVQKGFEVFTKMFMKYDIFGSRPLDIGGGIKMNASSVHTIEAIGKSYAKTVTSLSEYFMITKGAVSQVISKLHKEGYIRKVPGNNKEVILELTDSGRQVVKSHDKYNRSVVKKIKAIEDKYSQKEWESFLNILTNVDTLFAEFIEEIK
jgi:DNA-binding MarR family transcriptional regulator